MKPVKYDQIPIDQIEISPYNVRKSDIKDIDELAASIKEHDLLQPIVVYKDRGKYLLLIGQRRFLACKDKLKWVKIPAFIVQIEDETEAALVSFSENIHRLDLNYKDKMRVATLLLNNLKKVGKVAKALGVTDQTVRNYLGYQAVPEELKKMVDERKISARTASEIARNIPDEGKAIQIAKEVYEEPSTDRRKGIIETARENPSLSAKEIKKKAQKIKYTKVTLHLTSRIADALESACEDYTSEPQEIGRMAIEEWLNQRGFLK